MSDSRSRPTKREPAPAIALEAKIKTSSSIHRIIIQKIRHFRLQRSDSSMENTFDLRTRFCKSRLKPCDTQFLNCIRSVKQASKDIKNKPSFLKTDCNSSTINVFLELEIEPGNI
ncbi:hypothetical protein NE237_005483 [Protea cynaroides]|uniref:Uncharacterized protein n=1 Tax=Protea cynaroides TaxID=273540 RepID=A0A9Q0KLE3_9MAGN|nr:hypothetical protein NE237_005483 [Protea cynaroides]